jgi:hypothetical protein
MPKTIEHALKWRHGCYQLLAQIYSERYHSFKKIIRFRDIFEVIVNCKIWRCCLILKSQVGRQWDTFIRTTMFITFLSWSKNYISNGRLCQSLGIHCYCDKAMRDLAYFQSGRGARAGNLVSRAAFRLAKFLKRLRCKFNGISTIFQLLTKIINQAKNGTRRKQPAREGAYHYT